MIGKSLNEFLETLTYGYEMEFIYFNRYFIIQGDTNDNQCKIRLDEYSKDDDTILEYEPISLVVFGKSFEECVKKLVLIPLIDGKTIYELEKDIEVIYG